MANPLKSMQRTREEYRSMDRLDRRRFWSDSILNNALYILMFVFVVYTANKNKNFLAPGSIVNILSLVAASLPMALGIAGCIVLTGTGKISGIVLGVFILRIIFVALSMLGINANMQYIIKGAIILAACSLDMRKYLVRK